LCFLSLNAGRNQSIRVLMFPLLLNAGRKSIICVCVSSFFKRWKKSINSFFCRFYLYM
jgi:hypothetical protein